MNGATPLTHRPLAGTGPAASPWPRTLATLAVLLAVLLAMYRETALSMVHIWARSETFTHGFVVPVIVAWLVWRLRERLAATVPVPSAAALLPLSAAAFLWLLGDLASVNAAAQFALTALVVLVVVTVLGWRAARVIAFPLAFLFFAVPVGEFMMPQLMVWTADFTAAALRVTGVPVYREGLQLVIPTGTWSIIEACSGIRYLMASMMVGTLYAYLHYRSLRRRLLFIGVSIAVPIVANWVRAYLIVIVGHLSSNQIATGADHLVYGWIFFGVVIGVTFLIGARWSEMSAPPRDPGIPPVRTAPEPLWKAAWAVPAACALLVATPAAVVHRLSQAVAPAPVALAEAPALRPPWQPASWTGDAWMPAYAGASAESHRAYVAGDTPASVPVGVYVAYYRHQVQGRELVSSENVLVRSDDHRWSIMARGVRQVDAAPDRVTVSTAELGPRSVWQPDRRLTVWQVYWINGPLVADEPRAKVLGALNRLSGRGDDAAVLMVYTAGTGAQAQDRLAAFLRSNLEPLVAQLAATRGMAGAGSP